MENVLAEAYKLLLRDTLDRLANQIVETHNAHMEIERLKAEPKVDDVEVLAK